MRVIQHNCHKSYAVCQATFQVGVEIGAELLCIQEPCLGEKGMVHPAYEIVLGNVGDRRQQRVAMGVKKDLGGRLIVENRSDLVNHPYIQVFDVWELDSSRKKKRKTRIVNVYDNWVGEGQIWRGITNERRRAINDVNWSTIIENRTIIVGDFNAHSPYWNPLCRDKQRSEKLETLIDSFGLLINNDFSKATRAKRTPGHSIIDLTFTTSDMGYLPSWTIDPEYATPSDHELITFDVESLSNIIGSLGPSTEITGWAVKDPTEEQERTAFKMWREKKGQRPIASNDFSKSDLDEEAQWISDTLTHVLDHNFKKL